MRLKRVRWLPFIVCLLIPLAVGGLSSLLTRGSMEDFYRLNQPPLTPPEWVFPVVWTILYLLMGWASYIVYAADAPSVRIKRALIMYGAQLIFNFCWTLLYFNAGLYLLAFIWLVILWLLIWSTMAWFWRVSRLAGGLMLPYLAWVAFAGYLNMGVFLLNR